MRHYVYDAPTTPWFGKRYKAVLIEAQNENGKVSFGWKIYSGKDRKPTQGKKK